MLKPGEPNAGSDVTWYGPGSAFGAPSRGNAREIISRVMPGGCARHTPAPVRKTAAAAMRIFCIIRLLRKRNSIKLRASTPQQNLPTQVLDRPLSSQPRLDVRLPAVLQASRWGSFNAPPTIRSERHRPFHSAVLGMTHHKSEANGGD